MKAQNSKDSKDSKGKTNCIYEITYLMMSLEGLFVIDTTASADPLHFEVGARNLMLDLMHETFVAYLVARH